MTKKVFNGIINGVEYTNVTDFNKALFETKAEDLKEVSSSFKMVETNEDAPEVNGRQVVKDAAYNPFEILGSIFGPIFGSFQSAQTPVAKLENHTDFNPNDFIVKCNLDKLTGEDAKDEKMLDDYDRLLEKKRREFEDLTDEQKCAVKELVAESKADAEEIYDVTQNKIDVIERYYEEKFEELDEEREAKENVLFNSRDALDLLLAYYEDLENE